MINCKHYTFLIALDALTQIIRVCVRASRVPVNTATLPRFCTNVLRYKSPLRYWG
ncbi:hypothetical protein MGSAQ_002054 [marine sediment metagenome]|uniref:Uncharacterized protein n=1 Tax=marine sediment metagenome TaxID=412755 RepID=A0A1B6NSY2_9ZZZZ